MIVVLLGYMASGKSTIGKILAKKLNYQFMDLDAYIEQKEQNSVKDIFRNKGEIYFRKKESLYLNELINCKENLVLSLGGGTPCYGSNMEDILNTKTVTSIYLKASIPTLINRLQNEKDSRPLVSHLKSKESLEEYVGKHIFERSPFYSRSHLTISTDEKPENEIIEAIHSMLF